MIDYTEVKRLYDMGLTDSEISRRLNISRLSIRNWRKQEGLETRYATSQKVNTGNICFDCRRPSVLCPWLLEEAPVPGWTAIPTKINNFHAAVNPQEDPKKGDQMNFRPIYDAPVPPGLIPSADELTIELDEKHLALRASTFRDGHFRREVYLDIKSLVEVEGSE